MLRKTLLAKDYAFILSLTQTRKSSVASRVKYTLGQPAVSLWRQFRLGLPFFVQLACICTLYTLFVITQTTFAPRLWYTPFTFPWRGMIRTVLRRVPHHNREMDVLVPKADILAFVQRVMAKAGANQPEAACLGEALVNADYRSHFSHGLNRLEFYYNDMKAGAISTSTQSKVSLTGSPSTARGSSPRPFPLCVRLDSGRFDQCRARHRCPRQSRSRLSALVAVYSRGQ